MKTNKDKAQKMISAKIVAKLVELANKHVVPCININVPGKYTAKEMATEVDSLGNKLFYKFDYDNSEVQELVVRIADDDFSQTELAELGFSPKIKLTLICEKVFLAIAKYERLAGIRLADVAKFVVGEPAKIYETERAKVTIYDREADTIVTKTKKITVISDTQALYKHDKKTITLCLKINGKWFAVLSFPIAAYDFDAIVEILWEKCNIDNIRKGVKAKANSQVCNKFVEFCRLIQSELDSMDKHNAEASKAQAADNVVADSESNANVATENKEPAETAEQSTVSNAGKETPLKDSGTPRNQCGRKIADLSEFYGCGDKRYHPSGENRNMGIYCGKNEVLSAEVRGSPQSATINSILTQTNIH